MYKCDCNFVILEFDLFNMVEKYYYKENLSSFDITFHISDPSSIIIFIIALLEIWIFLMVFILMFYMSMKVLLIYLWHSENNFWELYLQFYLQLNHQFLLLLLDSFFWRVCNAPFTDVSVHPEIFCPYFITKCNPWHEVDF